MQLTFNEEGKLLGGTLPRYKPDLCKRGCKNDYSLSIRVLLPLDYLEEESKSISETSIGAYKALSDEKSILYKILCCKDNGLLTGLQKIITDSNMHKWQIDTIQNLMPPKLHNYSDFIDALKKADTSRLNHYKEFSPFRLKIKGIEMEEDCFRFIPFNNKNDECDCIKENKKYVAIVFGIPPKLITSDLAIDSFQLIRKFRMKEIAVAWYNNMLKENKNGMMKLKLIEESVKKRKDTIALLINQLDTLEGAEGFCTNIAELGALQERVKQKICVYKSVIDSQLGSFDCTGDTCNTSNILFCSDTLRSWVSKLIWLNGEYIRMNPFNFTSDSKIINKKTVSQEDVEKRKDSIRNANIEMAFWDTAINHLRDSIMLTKTISIDSGRHLLAKLLKERDAAVKLLNESNSVIKNADIPAVDAKADNASKMKNFITTTQVNYKGWLVPYMLKDHVYKPDKMWLRNYYLDQYPNALRNKLHFTYPEDENVTLLLHNIPAGTGMTVTETLKPFADSAAFTILAGETVTKAAALYSSLGKIEPIVKKLLHAANFQNGGTPSASELKVLVNSGVKEIYKTSFDGAVPTEERFKNATDSISMYYKKPENKKQKNKDLLTVTVSNPVANYYLTIESTLNGIPVAFTQLKNKSNQLPGPCTVYPCYINYIKGLYTIANAPSLIEGSLKTIADTTPMYSTARYQLSDKEAPYKMEYKIQTFTKNEKGEVRQGLIVDSSYIKVGKFYHFQLAAGVAYTPNGGSITSVDTSNGGFKINRDEDKARLIAGLRWYPWGVYNLDNPVSVIREFRWLHRLNVIVATGIPKPLENLYLGGGFDIVPGFNFSAGAHWQRQNKYSILNNQIKDQSIGYTPHFFYSITVDPGLLVNVISTLFK